MKLEVK